MANAKAKHRVRLLEFLSNPESDFPSRTEYARILGIARNTVYKHFTPAEMTDIENEAVENRKKGCGRQRAQILNSLFKRATGFNTTETRLNVVDGKIIETQIVKEYPPDRAAAQEFLDRTEGKVIDKKEISGPNGKELVPVLNVEFTGDKS